MPVSSNTAVVKPLSNWSFLEPAFGIIAVSSRTEPSPSILICGGGVSSPMI